METTENNEFFIYSWGFGKYGQLSEKYIHYSLEPIFVNSKCDEIKNNKSKDLSKKEKVKWIEKKEVYAGENHSAILLQYETETNILFFGKNTFSQLGLSHSSYINIPTSLNFKKTVCRLSLGGEHSLLLTSNKELYSFGLNIFGQLGVGDNNNRQSPTLILRPINFEEDEMIIDISAGAQHSMLLSNKNKIYLTGCGKSHALGIFDSFEDMLKFTLIENNLLNEKNEISSIRTGVYHSACLLSNKTEFLIWGEGDVLKYNEVTSFGITDIDGDNNDFINDIQIGDDFLIILTEKGKVFSIGKNNKGQLGIGNSTNQNQKFNRVSDVLQNKRIISINVGYEFTVSVADDDKIYVWGSNNFGQLTLTNSSYYTKPQLLEKLSLCKPIQIACGGNHIISLFENQIPSEQKKRNSNMNIDQTLLKDLNVVKIKTCFKNDVIPLKQKLLEIRKLDKEIDSLKEKKKKIDEELSELKEIKEKNSSKHHKNKLAKYCRGFENEFEINESELEIISDEKEIGRGTFGEVVKGLYRGQLVAIKFLKEALQTSLDNLVPFIKECIIMKNLRHPNILLCLGACTTGPQYFLVTELCENGNLFELLHQRRNIHLRLEERKRIALEICYGMNYLHSFKPPILHRDLKSMNILLDKNYKIKLADFGTIKSLNTEMTKQKGTFQWMAPEVIRGGRITEKSDVFSFGIIMNEIITRAPPYQGVDKSEVAKKVVNNPRYRPGYDKERTPTAWANLMAMCYDHNPSKRPTFAEIIDILEKMELKK